MPQESLRSAVYRSFVICEDPRGVVEGKTIRISKTDSAKMSTRRTENEIQSKSSKEKMTLEVKNGARKLNEAIESWSKGASFKSQTEDFAKDLLKGALDLQESLMMLGKLQEVSCMTNMKKKQEKSSEELFSRNGSGRFESFRNDDSGYQKERKLANGSSRDCFTELREVIQEGLSKHNLLPPNKSYQESAFSNTYIEGLAGRRKLQLSSDASTSSSTSSSMVFSTQEFTSSDSFSSRATEEKPKGSNLIAKLMGLEELHEKPARKQLDVIGSKMRPVFDVDLRNAKKAQIYVQNSNQEHMSLDEIINMMQSKGVLRSNKREIKQTSKRFEDEARPIVLMRPQRAGLYPDNQRHKADENLIRKLHQEKAKTEEKSVKTRCMSKPKSELQSNKQKASVPVATIPQRKQEVEKKTNKIQKAAPPIKKKTEENAKPTNSISKNCSSKPKKNTKIEKPNNQKKNKKIEKPIMVHEVFQSDSRNQEESKISEVISKEIDNGGQNSLCEGSEKDSYHVQDAITGMDQSGTRNNQEENVVSEISEPKARILKTRSIFQESEPSSFELLHDCIDEFFEQENERKTPLIPRSILPSSVCISEDQMMRNFMKNLENLRNFSKFSNKSCEQDPVFRLLERDMNLSTIGSAWSSSGWKDGCTVNEVEETFLDLENMILSRLIDDVLLELV